MAKVLNIDIEKCTGCRSCEMACSLEHEGEYNPALSRIRVACFPEKLYAVPIVCYQCEDAWCAKSCPANAIKTVTNRGHDLKLVDINHSDCILCDSCKSACPFGNIFIHNDQVKKCDLCKGNPKCVAVCSAGALSFR